jgi:mono/diheme cytochrome c family protein
MRRRWLSLSLVLISLAWAGTGSPILQAPRSAAGRPNPVRGSAPDARAGAKLYARECAACHGINREGIGKAPSLDRPVVHRAAPGTLFWALRNGSLWRGMPSFAHLPERERWQIICFLQGVSEENPK